MPPTTSFEFGDIVLVPFPFTNQAGTKHRPAVVVSSAACNQTFPDVVLMAITSQVQKGSGFHLPITGWKKAGLIGPSTIKPVLATFEKTLLLRRLGRLERPDRLALESLLRRVLSP